MQDKTEFMPLGKAIPKPVPVKADPVRDFEKHNHDIPGAPKLPRVTPEMAARALRSLCVDGLKEAYDREQAKIAAQSSVTSVIGGGWTDLTRGGHWTNVAAAVQASQQMERLDKLSELSKPPALTWPTLPDLPEPTFLPEVVNEAPSKADIAQFEVEQAEERARVGSMVLEVEKQLCSTGCARVNKDDMAAIREWFGPLGTPDRWDGRVFAYSFTPRMAV